MYYIKDTEVPALAARLSENGSVYVPAASENRFRLIPYQENEKSGDTSVLFNDFRTEFPYLKSFLFNSTCSVAKYPEEPAETLGKSYLFGIKACDLRGKAVLDKVFLEGEYIDPFYKERSENTIIISGDCSDAKDTCYCTLVNGEPFPEEGFDLNMSHVKGGFIIDSGSDAGTGIINAYPDLFQSVTDEQVQERSENRQVISKKIAKINESLTTTAESRRQSIQRNLNSQSIWDKSSQTCVACNACNYICPTCYCFLLYDRKNDGGNERIKVWDSCFHSGYARMAGGLTPRLRLVERFKNHYYHKFDSYVSNFGFEACSGCGRCINACSGKIDKRKVLKDLERYVELQ